MSKPKVPVHVYVDPNIKQKMQDYDINWSEYLRMMVRKKLDVLEGKKRVWCR